MSFEYWYMFPVAILVSTTAMASGIGGATFFAPIFILALRLPPEIAIGAGLITEVFGFASGLVAYMRKRLIDVSLGAALLVVTIPAALAGAWAAGGINSEILKVILGMGLLAVAISFLRALQPHEVERMDAAIAEDYGGDKAETCLTTAEGERICYTVCNRREGRMFAAVGGLFVGMISTGLGELNDFFLLRRCGVPSKVSVATSVFVVAFTALSAAAGHLYQFIQAGDEVTQLVLNIVTFTVPGVLIGGQLGSRLGSRLPQHTLERSLGMLFMAVAALTLGEAFL